MNASIHAFSRIPDHLDAEERPHLVGKQVCVKYGKLMYKFFVGNKAGQLILKVHLSSRGMRTRAIDWNDPIQVSRIPERVATYARTWFSTTVTEPTASPDFLDRFEDDEHQQEFIAASH